MATQQPLEYVAVDVTDAVVLDSGVVDVAQEEVLPTLPAHTPTIRLFHLSGTANRGSHKKAAGLPWPRVMALMNERLPHAVKSFLSHRPKSSGKHYFFQISLKGGVRELESLSRKDTDLLQTWARVAKDEDVLLQVFSTNDQLSGLVTQLTDAGDVVAQRGRMSGRHHLFAGKLATGAVHDDGVEEASARPLEMAPLMPRETQGAAARRQALLDTGWLDSAGVARELGSQATSNRSQHAAQLRKQGKLLGVWVPAEKGFRHPLCQFHDHALLPVMEPLLALLPKGNGSGWSQAQWLYSPHALLNQRTPADLLATEPGCVLAAAKDEYGEDAHARW